MEADTPAAASDAGVLGAASQPHASSNSNAAAPADPAQAEAAADKVIAAL